MSAWGRENARLGLCYRCGREREEVQAEKQLCLRCAHRCAAYARSRPSRLEYYKAWKLAKKVKQMSARKGRSIAPRKIEITVEGLLHVLHRIESQANSIPTSSVEREKCTECGHRSSDEIVDLTDDVTTLALHVRSLSNVMQTMLRGDVKK